jgi:hypothetical protein
MPAGARVVGMKMNDGLNLFEFALKQFVAGVGTAATGVGKNSGHPESRTFHVVDDAHFLYPLSVVDRN